MPSVLLQQQEPRDASTAPEALGSCFRRSTSFAEQAARLAGLAGVLVGWVPDSFWRSTPAELEAVLTALAGPRDAASPPDAATIAALKEQFPDG